MTAQIERARPADAALVALLGRVTFAETFGYLFTDHEGDLRSYLDGTFEVAKVERSLGREETTWWLAFVRGLPVGYAKLKHASPPPGRDAKQAAQLQKIYVLRAFLGEGIGRTLLGRVAEEAAGQAPLLWLDVLRENVRAIRFYEQNGFVAAGEDVYVIGAQRFRFSVMTRRMS